MSLPHQRLRRVVRQLRPAVYVPEKNGYRKMDDEALWRAIVGQVCVAGGSKPWVRLKAAWESDKEVRLSHKALLLHRKRRGATACEERIGAVLSEHKIRFPMKKATALTENLQVLKEHGGPKAFVQWVASEPSKDARIARVMGELAYVKKKGSRDLLMNLGLLRDAIAFDVRVMAVLRAAGIAETLPTSKAAYAALEDELLTKVCAPLDWEGVELDRTMYQYREAIVLALETGKPPLLPQPQRAMAQRIRQLEKQVKRLKSGS